MRDRLSRYIKLSNSIRVADNKLYLGCNSCNELVAKYQSPLYVYLDDILRDRCREVRDMVVGYENVTVNYSIKANSNIALLKIVREEGLCVDAMSPGEILFQLEAGFSPEQIFYIGNNVDEAEMRFAIKKGVKVSVDSLAQLEMYGRLNPGGPVAVRINPGIGDGHHEKVVTAGEKAKFGVYYTDVEEIKKIAQEYNLHVTGLNMHIGSHYLDDSKYIAAAERLMQLAAGFPDLDFIDIGGGLGIPYDKREGRLDLAETGRKLGRLFKDWAASYGKQVKFMLEPGRYIVAESGILLTKVNSVKTIAGRVFIGTDAGFSVLVRPTMYGSYHEIFNADNLFDDRQITADICGNICESGDLLARDREISRTIEGDVLAVMDAGAYGYSMASNYNARLRPAEVLVQPDGSTRLIREREKLDDLLRHQVY